ncbi:MAG: hypothetical protein ACMXX9_04275 [Candidatus Woesearchaeota archaeon]
MSKKIIIRDEDLKEFSENYPVKLIPEATHDQVSMLRVFKDRFNGYNSVLSFNMGLDISAKHVFDEVTFINYNGRVSDALKRNNLKSYRSIDDVKNKFGVVLFNGITSDFDNLEKVLDDNHYVVTTNNHGVAYDLWNSNNYTLIGGIGKPNSSIILTQMIDGFRFNKIDNEDNYFKSLKTKTSNRDINEKYVFIKD